MSEVAPALSSGDALGREAWDRLLLEHPEGNLLQSWTWGTLQSRFGWTTERLLFHQGRAGLCSLQRSRGVLPGGAIYYAPRGPVVPESGRLQAVDQLEQHARHGRGLVLSVEPNALAGDEWPAFFEGRGFIRGRAIQPEATRLLPIAASPDSLRAAFKPKTRYNLSLAERKGVTVERSQDVAAFAGMANETARRQGIHLPGVAYYQACLELFEPLDQVRLYLAHHEGDALGGIMVFRFGKTAYYLFGGSTDKKRELMPNYLLHWQAILDFRELGCEVYDWWGIPEEPAPDHPWFGLYRFKTGFGGETVRYVGLYERPLRPAALRIERGLNQLKTRIRRSILR
ncbi:MAG: peptidoglycan bridge formation glycyltransferase FemA/FemB family protein [Candidatus Dormibacteraeota bacterium]|nr:peptidoglycan bridge formation glycyltransferase FemA/FemB family protein [Candidatus Dormibacteraeota bacterium]